MSRKKEKTIRQRVEEFVQNYDILEEARGKATAGIMELIERAKSPEMFCPKCDTRMSIDLESGILNCFSCGFKKKIELFKSSPVLPVKSYIPIEPNKTPPDPRLLKTIDKLEKNDTVSRKQLTPSDKGESIRKLANDRGATKVTKEDDEFIKNSVPGAKNSEINWV